MAAESNAPLALITNQLAPADASDFEPSAMAAALFYLLRDRGQADGLYVLGRLQALYPDEPDEAQERWCIEALNACRDDAPERALSRRRYDEWYDGLQDKSVWPHSTDIRRTFGSWPAARARVEGTPLADPRALRQLRRGPECDYYGLIETLRAWHAELEQSGLPTRLTLDRFRSWARRKRKDSACHLQLPVDHKVWKRLFGGWGHALVAAGLSNRSFDEPPLAAHSKGFAHVSDEQLLALLAAVAKHLDRVPSCAEYERAVSKVLDRVRGLALTDPPSASAYIRRFGGWVESLWRAGLITKQQAAKRPRHRARVSNAVLVRELEPTVRKLGCEFGATAYRRWRADRLGTEESGIRTPSDALLRQRFGSLKATIEEVLKLHPELRGWKGEE